jgi:hypothetical protein
MITLFFKVCSLLLLMLVTGIFCGPLFALHRSLKVFTAGELIKLVKTMSDNLAVPMRILMPGCIILMTVTTWIYQQENSTVFYLSTVSIIFIIISLIITVAVEVPIVTNIQTWTPETVPSDWQAIRDRWVKFHFIRTAVAILSFVCFSISLLLKVI